MRESMAKRAPYPYKVRVKVTALHPDDAYVCYNCEGINANGSFQGGPLIVNAIELWHRGGNLYALLATIPPTCEHPFITVGTKEIGWVCFSGAYIEILILE